MIFIISFPSLNVNQVKQNRICSVHAEMRLWPHVINWWKVLLSHSALYGWGCRAHRRSFQGINILERKPPHVLITHSYKASVEMASAAILNWPRQIWKAGESTATVRLTKKVQQSFLVKLIFQYRGKSLRTPPLTTSKKFLLWMTKLLISTLEYFIMMSLNIQ